MYLRDFEMVDWFQTFSLQQAYHAIAVSRQMKLLALNSSNRSSRENNEKPKEEVGENT